MPREPSLDIGVSLFSSPVWFRLLPGPRFTPPGFWSSVPARASCSNHGAALSCCAKGTVIREPPLAQRAFPVQPRSPPFWKRLAPSRLALSSDSGSHDSLCSALSFSPQASGEHYYGLSCVPPDSCGEALAPQCDGIRRKLSKKAAICEPGRGPAPETTLPEP